MHPTPPIEYQYGIAVTRFCGSGREPISDRGDRRHRAIVIEHLFEGKVNGRSLPVCRVCSPYERALAAVMPRVRDVELPYCSLGPAHGISASG